jgi:hypothetical protein
MVGFTHTDGALEIGAEHKQHLAQENDLVIE